MVKAYLRYEFSGAFGVITSNSNVVFDSAGKCLLTAALESVAVWNLKQGSKVQSLTPGPSSSSSASAAEVTAIARAPTGSQIAVGYSDGTVRLWDASSGECAVALKGHKSAVSCLCYSDSGSLLASGSNDTDVIMWDVAGEAGLYRLRGHKDQVTAVAFGPTPAAAVASTSAAAAAGPAKLVTSSKDGYVKVWDLETQHCVQTVTGHRGEVWALALDPSGRRLVTGSNDQELRVFAVGAPPAGASNGGDHHQANGGGADAAAAAAAVAGTSGGSSSSKQYLFPMGSVRRSNGDRVLSLAFDGSGQLLGCQAAGKRLELFRMRSEDEAKRKMKRRKKRKREKESKKGSTAADGDDGDGDAEDGGAGGDVVQASDEFEAFQVISAKHKVRSFAFAPAGSPHVRKGTLATVALALTTNVLELVSIGGEGASEVLCRLDQAGHRSDIRAVALSPDDSTLLSVSNGSAKAWNAVSGACTGTMDCGYGLCCMFAPGGRHAVVGTKEGTLEVFDLGQCSCVHVESAAHTGPVWSLAPLPDKSGFISGGADKQVRFWQWAVVAKDGGGGSKQLRLAAKRQMTMADDVLCVRVSPDGRLLAVALLDATIKVFFLDTLKFFLSLYGHKLPVLCMDISSDGTLLVSGSADKNIKVWGLDFGDCHKSLFAHQDSVMQVAFVRNTHYAFTAGKDKLVKYWDLDRNELLLELGGHHGEVWALAPSSYGDFIITGSHDRSLRRWERTTEPFFVEEEKERRLESLFEADLEGQDRAAAAAEASGEEGAVAPAGRKTLESLGAADAIVDALEMAAHEVERVQEHAATAAQQGAAARGGGKGGAPSKPLPVNPLMLGLSPSAYVLKAVSGVKANDLEQALLMLPFTDALRLLAYVVQWLDHGSAVELSCRVSTLLLRLHHAQLVATAAARPVLLALQKKLRSGVQGLKDALGYNLAALTHLQRLARERAQVSDEGTVVLGAKRALGKD